MLFRSVSNIFSSALESSRMPVVAECWGGPVIVYSTKTFPGLAASTDLTKVCIRLRPFCHADVSSIYHGSEWQSISGKRSARREPDDEKVPQKMVPQAQARRDDSRTLLSHNGALYVSVLTTCQLAPCSCAIGRSGASCDNTSSG